MSHFAVPGFSFKEKQEANRLVAQAIREGSISRPKACSRCQKKESWFTYHPSIVAHHDDYSDPLAVTWLCTGCHGIRHRELSVRDLSKRGVKL